MELPRDRLIVFTGLSGSGKSSLAFDTIYAEGQRRYVESLSAYARQFLGQMDKPDVDFIEGLSPAISIDQKSASRNPRSTVGTITEIYDYLRLLYARIGQPHCPSCGRLVSRQTPAADRRPGDGPAGREPLPGAGARRRGPQGRVRHAARRARLAGFARARIDGTLVELAGAREATLARYEQHTIEVVVDRLVRRDGIERRLTDSIETALRLGEGVAEILLVDGRTKIAQFSEHLACTVDGHLLRGAGAAQLLVQLALRRVPGRASGWARASRSTPPSSCPTRRSRSATAPSRRGRARAPSTSSGCSRRRRAFGIDLDPLDEARPRRSRRWSSTASGDQPGRTSRTATATARPRTYDTTYEGVIPWLQRRHGEAESDWQREQIEGYMREVPCPACDGPGCGPESLAVTVGRHEHRRGRAADRSARR